MSSYLLQGLYGERSLTKVAGLFTQKSQAESSMAQMVRAGGLQQGQVRLLGPQDARISRQEIFSRAVEPEGGQAMARSFWQAHAVTGLAGAAAGLALFMWFLREGQPMVASSPLLAFLAMVGFGTTFGLMFGGLLALRPDHVLMITRVRSALRHNRWAVVAHPTSPEQTARVKAVLEGSSAEVVSTL